MSDWPWEFEKGEIPDGPSSFEEVPEYWDAVPDCPEDMPAAARASVVEIVIANREGWPVIHDSHADLEETLAFDVEVAHTMMWYNDDTLSPGRLILTDEQRTDSVYCIFVVLRRLGWEVVWENKCRTDVVRDVWGADRTSWKRVRSFLVERRVERM
jgi:hypothetical protein